MFYDSKDDDWGAQWKMSNPFLPQRTIFKKTLPAQLSRRSVSFLPYHRPDLKAPLFEPISEFVNRCKKDTAELCGKFISNNSEFFSNAKGDIDANIRFVLDQEDFRVVDALGFVPSFKDLLELWANPRQLAKANCITTKLSAAGGEKDGLVVDVLSTLIIHSNRQLTDTVRALYGSSMAHPMVQRLMRIFTNLAGPSSIVDFKTVSQGTKTVCMNLVEILCDAIKRRIEKGDLVTTMALADHVKARILLSARSDEKGIVLDKALLFHPETFVSMGPITDVNFERIVERSFYLGIMKWRGSLAKLLMCKYLDGHDFEPSGVEDIIPDGDDALYAYLPGRIPLTYKYRTSKTVTGPSFRLTSESQFSVSPIPLNCSSISDGNCVANVTFEASGGTVMVRIDDSPIISFEEGGSKVTVAKIDRNRQEYSNSSGTGARGCHKMSICWNAKVVVIDGIRCENVLCKPPRSMFFAGNGINVSNLDVEYKLLCKYGDKCKNTNDPGHMDKYHHFKKD